MRIGTFEYWQNYYTPISGVVYDQFNTMDLWYDINTPPMIFAEVEPAVLVNIKTVDNLGIANNKFIKRLERVLTSSINNLQ